MDGTGEHLDAIPDEPDELGEFTDELQRAAVGRPRKPEEMT